MARIARVVAPGLPHHITQRGNRRLPTFFCVEEYQMYLSLLSDFCARYHVEIWAYCLMPNHVHLIAVANRNSGDTLPNYEKMFPDMQGSNVIGYMSPEFLDGLRGALFETHRRYTRYINFREDWRGHLWQERFASFVMDYRYTLAAVRYIELNPVRAGLATQAGEYPWSRVHSQSCPST